MPPRRGHDEKSSKNHIPRPPNAFILFRSSFIRSNHVPGKVEGNHSTLSKIIGLCWKALSPQERQSWEEKARVAQAEHRNLYPDWRWTPEANALGKKRTRKSKKQHDHAEDSSMDDPESSSRRKSKTKDKGKARERSHDRDDRDEDLRVAKIADLVKEGKTGAELEKALEQWQATLTPADPRPTKKRRISRKQDSPSVPSATPRPTSDATHAESPSQPSSSSVPAPISPSPTTPSEPPPIHVFRRSPSDPAQNSDLPRLTTQSDSLITRDASHTPSPTLPFYNSHPTVETNTNPLTTLTWSENTTPASYPASQPSYSQWWSSTPSAPSSSPFGTCYETPEITTDGLGYEGDTNFDREYAEQFQQIPQSHSDSEDRQWTRNAGRNGLCIVVNDPLRECNDSPIASSPSTFPPPVEAASPPAISPPPSTTFFNSDGTLSPVNAATAFIPSSTYSSLTGWAGEYVDHPGVSSNPSTSTGWFSSSWQGPQRASTSWGQQNDIPESSRPNTESSHHKAPYLEQPSLRLQPPPPATVPHQLTSTSHPSSVSQSR